jgi:TolB-like protein/Flp pilus assembly protein TadD
VGARAFDVLQALIERCDRLVTKEELLDVAWPGLVVEENNLQVQISALRKLLGSDAIATVTGRGYRFTGALELADSQEAPRWAKTIPPIDESAPSIAVLPFTDLSPEKNQEYFADGLAEELLNVLSKVQGLRVSSRTSAFSFKGTNADIATMARKLNVSTILEGSVRTSGRHVRISAQLVQVATDSQLWSETYDRELNDIFAVQDDIAHAVVEKMRAALYGVRPDSSARAQTKMEVAMAAKGRGENVEAHRLHLQGRFFVDRSTRHEVTKGIKYLIQAVDLDPENALAWATLARAYASQASFAWAPFAEGFERARTAAQRALILEPDLAEGHSALGWVRLSYDWDWPGADTSLHRALELAPGNAEVVREAAFQAGCLGRHQEAVTLAKRSVLLDPLSVQALRTLCIRCLHAGFLDDAEAAIERALELLPDASRTHYHLGRVRLAQARFDEALSAFEHEVGDEGRLAGLILVQHARGRQVESDAALAELIAKHSAGCAYEIAQGYAYRGEADHAFNWLELAYLRHDPGLSFVKADPLLVRLRADSRWQPFLEKMRLAD